ncbi:choice-of-anchor P family protein [Amycolatopsis minnesotensis]|uniref:Secreted protein n=1 Tax=Amycolatopsis minnesotensis TaxID=337894 RepID=A0ABN2SSS0_9PSEU
MRVDLLRTGSVAGMAATALLLATVPVSAATAAGAGSAYGASASVSLLPGVLGDKGLTVNTGKLAKSTTEGPTSASVADAPLKGLLTAKAISSSAKHAESGGVTSTASIVDAALPVLAPLAGGDVSARVLKAKCASTASGVTGSSEIAGLDLGKIGAVPVATEPNRSVGLPGLVQVIVNEQIKHDDGSLTVNALHVKLLGGKETAALGSGDVVLASATCGKATATKPSTTPSPAPTTSPAAPKPGKQVTEVPVGAPQTGDGSLAVAKG